MSKPNLITIDLDALPGVLTESLRRVLTAHGYINERTGAIFWQSLQEVVDARLAEAGRNGAQAVAAATQLRGTDEQADALAELQEYLQDAAVASPPPETEIFTRWGDALRALRGG